MYSVINNLINKLQSDNILPEGTYSIELLFNPFSNVYRISINDKNYYLKQLKLRKGNSIEHIENILSSEYEALCKFSKIFDGNSGYEVPSPIYFSKTDNVLITKGLNGESVLDICRKYAKRGVISFANSDAINACRYSGKFIRALHEIESCAYSYEDFKCLLMYIEKRLLNGSFNKNQEYILKKYLANAEIVIKGHIHKYNKCFVHNDYGPGNILYHNNKLNILDFGDHITDSPNQDIIVFTKMMKRHLENIFKYNQDAIDKLITSFYNGYGFNSYDKNDLLYRLYEIKYYSIYLETYRRGEMKLFCKNISIYNLKQIILDKIEYIKCRNKILFICSS